MRRTPLIAIGVVLLLLGAAALAWQKITYTARETVVEVGPAAAVSSTG